MSEVTAVLSQSAVASTIEARDHGVPGSPCARRHPKKIDTQYQFHESKKKRHSERIHHIALMPLINARRWLAACLCAEGREAVFPTWMWGVLVLFVAVWEVGVVG